MLTPAQVQQIAKNREEALRRRRDRACDRPAEAEGEPGVSGRSSGSSGGPLQSSSSSSASSSAANIASKMGAGVGSDLGESERDERSRDREWKKWRELSRSTAVQQLFVRLVFCCC